MHPSSTAPQNTPVAHQAAAPALVHVPPAPPATSDLVKGIERVIVWIGSPASLALHTVIFSAFFAVSMLKIVAWDLMFAVLTNVVSLEAIYLAIFIQMSVNRQSASLKEVEEDVGDIQENIEELGENVEELGENVEELGENVEELGENVEDLKEDVEDIQEDIGEIGEDDDDEAREKKQAEMLEALTNDVKAMLKHLETLKGK
ncbi:MAG TPA: DUF1003 domain-containing protein [Rhizomicrobium sp.]|nr:DUF1003 domain-containing protein [Rhizomicrobium sp.]